MRDGKDQDTTLNSLQIETLISQEAERELSKVEQRTEFIEKENRRLTKDLTQTKNDYETLVQKNNLNIQEIENKANEIKSLSETMVSLKKVSDEQDKRIHSLTQERFKLVNDAKEFKLKSLDLLYEGSHNEQVESLQQENEMLKKILTDSGFEMNENSDQNFQNYKKKEKEYLREIENYRRNLVNYKEILKEMELLIKITKNKNVKDEHTQRINSAVDVDDVNIEGLMNTIKESLHT